MVSSYWAIWGGTINCLKYALSNPQNLPSASKLGVGLTYLTAPKSHLAFPKYSLRVEKSKQLRAPGSPALHPNTFPEGTCFQLGFPGGVNGKEPACQRRRRKFDPWVRKIPWRRKQQPPPISLSGKSHGQRSLAGTSLWGYKESDRTLRLNNNNNNAYSGLLMFVIDYQKVIGDGEVSAATSRHSL